MTDITPPPLSAEELEELERLCGVGITTLSDATMVMLLASRLLPEVKNAREQTSAAADWRTE